MGEKLFNVYPLHKIDVLMVDIRQKLLPNRWLRMQWSSLKVILIPKSKITQNPRVGLQAIRDGKAKRPTKG